LWKKEKNIERIRVNSNNNRNCSLKMEKLKEQENNTITKKKGKKKVYSLEDVFNSSEKIHVNEMEQIKIKMKTILEECAHNSQTISLQNEKICTMIQKIAQLEDTINYQMVIITKLDEEMYTLKETDSNKL
jgi:hypothetical protein